MRCSPSADNPALQTFDSHLTSAVSKITNSALSDIQWLQASMRIAHGGLGCEGCHRSQFLPFWLRRRAPFPFRTTSCHCVPVPLTHSLTSTYPSGPHWLVHHLIPYLEKSFWDKPGLLTDCALIEPSLVEPSQRARFLAAQAPHSGDWLLALPITNCGLRLDDEAVRVAVGMSLGCSVCAFNTTVTAGT